MGQFQLLPKEVQDKAMAGRQAMANRDSKEYKEMYARMVELFVQADANHNGVLERDEFHTFSQLTHEYQKSKYGDAVKQHKSTIDHSYDLVNKFSPEKEGLSFADLIKSFDYYEAAMDDVIKDQGPESKK